MSLTFVPTSQKNNSHDLISWASLYLHGISCITLNNTLQCASCINWADTGATSKSVKCRVALCFVEEHSSSTATCWGGKGSLVECREGSACRAGGGEDRDRSCSCMICRAVLSGASPF